MWVVVISVVVVVVVVIVFDELIPSVVINEKYEVLFDENVVLGYPCYMHRYTLNTIRILLILLGY